MVRTRLTSSGLSTGGSFCGSLRCQTSAARSWRRSVTRNKNRTPVIIRLRLQMLVPLAEMALRNRLPAASIQRDLAEAGFLLTYGADLSDLFRRAAGLVDKIFKGAKPADLPVEQPTKFELVVNLKTAKALGIDVPPTLL